MAIQRVGVIGAGTMGNGIAHVFARSGYEVILCDVEQRFLDRALGTIDNNLNREVKKGKISEADKSAAVARIHPEMGVEALSAADFAVEAVPERLDLKVRVLKDADAVLRPDVILASNTSSFSITDLAARPSRPERFIGMHFMNPVPVMVLVEV